MARESMDERLSTIGAKVAKMKEKGAKWPEIAESVGVSAGKCMLAFMFVSVPDKDRIKFKTDDDLALKIVKAREAELSWGQISARAGVPESKVRKLWEEKTGKSSRGERIGKGGRTPGANGTSTKAAPKAKGPAKTKAQAKAAAAVKKAGAAQAPAAKKTTAAPKTASFDFLNADLDALTERLEGRKLKVTNSKTNKDQVVSVKTVKNADAKNIEIIDAKTSASRTFARSAIVGATK